EAGQFDAAHAHDADTAKLKPFGKIEDGPAIHQRGEGVIGRQVRWAGFKGTGDPCRGDLATNDTLAGVGLEPIDPRRFVRQTLPDRQQEAGDDVDLAVRELRYLGDLRLPGAG